jgi:UDP-N-acetylglucosamine diphosphorylase/glucosamine-1-phosphate N-acetyltransferase
MNIVLFDEPIIRQDLLPFTFTRPVAEVRVGILTLTEKWKKLTGGDVSFFTQPYLSAKYPSKLSNDNYFINGAVVADSAFIDKLKQLKFGEGLLAGETLLATRTDSLAVPPGASLKPIQYAGTTLIDKPWKIFQLNGAQIRTDFSLLTKGRKSAGISDVHTRVYNPENIFMEEGATVRAAILNAENGPIYLDKNSQVHDGAMIRGPFYLGEGSHVNMGAKVRGDTTVGPQSKIGGEVSNVVIFGYSNKAHDGFLGNSVIGEWCNFGADSNTSNLKNNFEFVKVWSYRTKKFESTGLQFCGLLMGDHSKCGINTMFNTGTVVGVSANIFGAGFPRTFIPSFSWGGAQGYITYKIEKAFETALKAMERRNVPLSEVDKEILREVYRQTAEFRSWEKSNQVS